MNQRIEITRECAAIIGAKSFDEVPPLFIGCPASHAQGPTARSVVTEMYLDWAIPIANKFLVPKIGKLPSSLPSDNNEFPDVNLLRLLDI